MKPFKPAIISFVQTLRSLGFNSYPQYLRSDLWLSIKRRVMERDGYECGLCLARGRVVHHLKYNEETVKGETLDWLLTLCTKCHKSLIMMAEAIHLLHWLKELLGRKGLRLE